MTEFLQYLILGLTRGSMYALIALGYTLVYGVLQLINFAHSEVFMSGAFGSYIVVHLIVGNGKDTAAWAVPFVMLIGMLSGAIVAGIIAWTLERVAYRPLRKRGAPKLAFLISAIGASFFLATFVGKLFNSQTSNQFPVFFNHDTVLFSIDGAHVKNLQVVIIVTAAGRDGLPGPAGRADQTRPQHPGRLRGRPHRGADGHRHRQDDFAHVRHRWPARRCGRIPVRAQLQLRLQHGLRARHQGVRGGGAGWHRQHPRRHARRSAARHRREHGPGRRHQHQSGRTSLPSSS